MIQALKYLLVRKLEEWCWPHHNAQACWFVYTFLGYKPCFMAEWSSVLNDRWGLDYWNDKTIEGDNK